MDHATRLSPNHPGVIDENLLDSIRTCQEMAREGKLSVERTMALYDVLSALADCYLEKAAMEGNYKNQTIQNNYRKQR